MGSAIGEGVLQTFVFPFNCALAQITPDNTLPNNSSVTTQDNIRTIEGGTQSGSNLFHSFGEFSVPIGSEAYFNNALDIQNIISRVTGGSASNINGLIRANGTANLFLINPNGIVFSQNAQLNIGGSFVATTASAIAFGNQGFFSASNPESSSSLLTINPSALLFNQIKTASIENNTVATGLSVLDGNSMLLVGGDINMNGGSLLAFGGRVELGGLAGAGTVELNSNGSNLSLSFPNNVERSDVFLSNGAGVAVTTDDGGSIAINTRNLEMTQSGLFAGIASGLGSDNSKAGNIEVNATGVINLDNDSLIANQVGREANGQAGDINISANTFQVKGGAQVNAGTRGIGKGGSLTVDAQQVQLIGGDSQFVTSLSGNAQPNSTGDASDLTIRTNALLIRDGAQVSADTYGAGKGGSLTVDAQQVRVIGGDFPFVTGLSADAQPNSTGDAGDLTIRTNTLLVRDRAEVSADTFGIGKGGNLTIKTNNLLVQNGAQVRALTFGAGKGGNLSVNAQDVQLIGGDSEFVTGLYVSAQPNSTGDAGDLSVKTNTLLVRNRAQIGTDTFGAGKGGNLSVDAQDVQLIGVNDQLLTGLSTSAQPNSKGDAGDLNIKTNTLLVRDGAQVSAGSFSEGNAANLTVAASQAINLIGRRSRLFTQTQGSGASGNVQISTRQLTVQDGAQISTSSFAQGQGGSLFVNASESVELIGKSPDSSQVASGLFAQAQGAGAAGNLAIATARLIVRDGAQISATTYGQGQGGSLSVNASDSVELIGRGGLSTQAQGDGLAGNLTIATGKLIVRDEAQVLTTTYGQGQGGILSVNASDSVELIGRNSSLFADTQGDGAAGKLTITTGKLIVRDEAQIFTGTSGKGQGGNLIVNALESVEISSSADSSRFSGLFTATQGAGAAGDLTITTEQLTVKDKSQVAVASEGTGKAGNLDVIVPSILLDGNQAGFNAQTASGNGGNIRLQDLDLLLLRRGAQISTTAGTDQAGGNGGNINIDASSGFIVAVPSENSDITANAYTGSGGRVDIQAFGIYGIQPRQFPTLFSDITASSEFGVNGTVELNTPDIDPSSGLVNLPAVPVDTQVAQGCTAGSTLARSSFTITGRGGLPPNPGEALNADAVQVDLVSLNPEVAKPSTPTVSTNPINPTPARIVEATGWVIAANGDVILTNSAPTLTPHSSWQRTADCHVVNQRQGG
jgi:filamentous hemagglutinin family protein